MSFSAYLTAFWRGELSGPAEWLGWAGVVLLGLALGVALWAALCGVVAFLERIEDAENPDQVPPGPTPDRSRARFETIVTVLAIVAVPVIFLTR